MNQNKELKTRRHFDVKPSGNIKAEWYTGELKTPFGNELYREFIEDPVYNSYWLINRK